MKKPNKLSFHVETELAEDLERWASEEDIPLAQLERKLMWIAADLYREAGSFFELQKRVGEETRGPGHPRKPKKKKSTPYAQRI